MYVVGVLTCCYFDEVERKKEEKKEIYFTTISVS